MPFLVVNILKVLFVAALYGFLFYVARAMRGQVSGPPAGSMPSSRSDRADATPPPSSPIPIVMVRRADGSESRQALDRPLLVGRGDHADLRLDDDFASDRHARLEFDGAAIWLEDLGSTNGTSVNGVRIEGRVEVRRGSTLTVGHTKMVLQ